jgi:sterol desaturase/sphingolipid hydroxylase (fatty acid hydroxylase superfamily)
MIWTIAIIATLLYAALAEYAAHRWVMHYPGMGRSRIWRNHAVLHHRENRVDINIGLAPSMALLVLSPWLILALWLGWGWVSFLFGLSIGYGWLWTSIHAAIHGVDCLWMRRMPGFSIWCLHHETHHQQPFRNFGTIFIFTDVLFGTDSKNQKRPLPELERMDLPYEEWPDEMKG